MLTGADPEFATVGGDSLIYVVSRGTAGAADGRLSIVDPAINQEVVVINGLGELPGPPVFHPSGRLLIASEREGILEVNTLTRTLVRGVGAGSKPGGHGVAALALDQRGRIYALDRGDCTAPGVVHVLSAPPDYAELETVSVGACPSAAAAVFMQAAPCGLRHAHDRARRAAVRLPGRGRRCGAARLVAPARSAGLRAGARVLRPGRSAGPPPPRWRAGRLQHGRGRGAVRPVCAPPA